MGYIPFNYNQINLAAGHYMPSQVKSYNNHQFGRLCMLFSADHNR